MVLNIFAIIYNFIYKDNIINKIKKIEPFLSQGIYKLEDNGYFFFMINKYQNYIEIRNRHYIIKLNKQPHITKFKKFLINKSVFEKNQAIQKLTF